MAVGSFSITDSQGDGLQYLCSKYSSLISRLKDEVLARQKAEAEVRQVERRRREESSAHDAERSLWEEDRRALRNDLSAMTKLQHETAEHRLVEASDMQYVAKSNANLSAHCERLHENCSVEGWRTKQAMERSSATSEVLLRQGDELVRLRREHAELAMQHRDVRDELLACRENAKVLQRTIADLEGQLCASERGREEADARTRQTQDELRQALRQAAAAREREREASDAVSRNDREVRSREERLAAVRSDGQRHARRAVSIERRLQACEVREMQAESLAADASALRLRLENEVRACEAARVEAARAEAGEVRAVASCCAARSEALEHESRQAAAVQRTAEMEGEMAVMRSELCHLSEGRDTSLGSIEGLRQELQQARLENDECWRVRERLTAELAQARRRAERGNPELVECKRRLGGAEEALSRAQSVASEERRARERSHADAIRAGEMLRVSRSQCTRLRGQARGTEEQPLVPYAAPGSPARYSSRPRGRSGSVGAVVARPQKPTQAFSATPATSLGGPRRGLAAAPALSRAEEAGETAALLEFVMQEDKRLETVDCCASGSSWVESRPAPTPVPLPTGGGGSGAGDGPWSIAAVTTAATTRIGDEFSELLEAQPRVFRVPQSPALAARK
eukprot:TRINITY_DN62709_c0_g1_i1.p1 TRINITY_DN62709_c0_g1~~TRINITY_DN62709_c0_g1_i1.p1  ORF type:complete len:632 (+),score=115.30 TRINITY_DN62709_c0_g1_i1:87-1982(+)